MRVLIVVLLLVTGGKQSQPQVLGLRLEFDKKCYKVFLKNAKKLQKVVKIAIWAI